MGVAELVNVKIDPGAGAVALPAVVGAAVTTLLWLLATPLFRLYIQHFPPNASLL